MTGGVLGSDPTIPALAESELRAAQHPSPVDDKRAFLELQQLSKGKTPDELSSEAANAEHDRSQRFKNHFERLAICALYVSVAAVAIIAGIWLYHLLVPAQWRWLSTEDISHLQSIATAGLLVGVIGNHFKKRMG